MDLTLFIMIVLLIITILYGINILKDVKHDIKSIKGDDDNNNEEDDIINYIKNSLEYLKNLL
jgi:hypothetical protein